LYSTVTVKRSEEAEMPARSDAVLVRDPSVAFNEEERRNGRCHHVVVTPRFKPSKSYMHKLFNDLVGFAPPRDKKIMRQLRDYAFTLENEKPKTK
jgi:hypothetical protein